MFLPMQIQRKSGVISIVLSEKPLTNFEDLKTGGNGLEYSLHIKNLPEKDEVTLQNFNDKENRVGHTHSLTCKSLKNVQKNTALHFSYDGEIRTFSV